MRESKWYANDIRVHTACTEVFACPHSRGMATKSSDCSHTIPMKMVGWHSINDYCLRHRHFLFAYIPILYSYLFKKLPFVLPGPAKDITTMTVTGQTFSYEITN